MSGKKLLIPGMRTGFSKLDMESTGFHRGDLIFLAGRPCSGKTTFAAQVAEFAGLHENRTCLYFYLEWDALWENMIFRRAKLKRHTIHGDWRKNAARKVRERLLNAEKEFRSSRLFFDGDSNKLKDIIGRIKWLHSTKDLRFVVVDRIEILREPVVAVRKLKELAVKLDICILACTGLPRRVEHRKDKRPLLSDLRYSAKLEKYADVVMFLYRDSNNWEEKIMELTVCKNPYKDSLFSDPIKLRLNEYGAFEECSVFEKVE